MHQLVAVPVQNMYLVRAPQLSPARVMEGVDDRQLIGAGLARAREPYRRAVVVSVVFMAAQNGVRLKVQLGIA